MNKNSIPFFEDLFGSFTDWLKEYKGEEGNEWVKHDGWAICFKWEKGS